MWEPFRITSGELTGRVRAVSLPQRYRGTLAAWTDRGYHTITYEKSARVTRTVEQGEQRFDPDTGVLRLGAGRGRFDLYGRWESDGGVRTRLPESTPAHPAGERVEPDPAADALLVLDPAGAVRQRVPDFHHRTEPWAVAAFSPDGRVLLVADPRGVRLFQFFPDKGRENARWQAAGSRADRDALLAAVGENPADDTPRLVYADWLDEHGDPARAEFIRLQCGGGGTAREGELYHQFGSRWLAELPAVPGVRWDTKFVRGFPRAWVRSGAVLALAAEAVWAACPIEDVTLGVFTPNTARPLADCPYLARVRRLRLSAYDPRVHGGPEPLRILLESPHLGGLRRLEWDGSTRGDKDEGVGLIAACPRLFGLEELAVGCVTEVTALAVAASPHLRRLRRLEISTWRYPPETLAGLRARFPDQKW